jgi:hypothetical protein
VLLYDIFWYFPLGKQLRDLLREVSQLLKEDGVLSVLPQHIDVSSLEREIEGAGFHLERRNSSAIFHDHHIESGEILTFTKASPIGHT